MDDVKFENPEDDAFLPAAKSSVKLEKNSRGINYTIKVVSGEMDLIDDLLLKAISCYKKAKEELEDE